MNGIWKRIRESTEWKLMNDAKLNESIQRWENEGGRVFRAHRGRDLETVTRKQSALPWNKHARASSENAPRPREILLRRSQPPASGALPPIRTLNSASL
jgi:hypothetical protein